MKIRKFPQSHLLIYKEGKKLVIDPGYLTFQQGFKMEEFQGADLYLITHQHEDHLDPATIKEVVGDKPVFGNSDVVGKLRQVGVEGREVKNGEELEEVGFKIKAVELPHFRHPLGNPMPPNTGFIIDEVFFHAGDGFEISGIQVEKAALPIGHPSVSTTGVFDFAKSLGAKLVIPIHYDAYPRDPEEFKKIAEGADIEVRVLKNGEETEI
jgi:L-ascorbate metabolism protein UlaG (beta-lactamase superfamily)